MKFVDDDDDDDEAYFHLRMHWNRLAAGLCPDPLVELTALPRPRSWLLGRGTEKGKEGEGKQLIEGGRKMNGHA